MALAVKPVPPALGGGILNGGNLVRMIYLDESGVSDDEPYLVVAGAIIHADKQWKMIEKYLHNMVEALIPSEMRPDFCFHATELYSGTKRFHRDRWPKEARWKILDELVSTPAKFDLPLVCGYVPKADFKGRNASIKNRASLYVNAQAVSLLICSIGFEYLANNAADDGEVGLLIAEDNKEARRLMRNVINFNRNPDLVALLDEETRRHVPLTRIVDTVHYAEKLDSSPLQIADACAFSIMRRLRRGKDSERFYKPLESYLVRRPNLERLDIIDLPSI